MLSQLALVAAVVLAADAPSVKLAAPGFKAVQVGEDVVRFYSDHFAQQLVLNGLHVITAAQVSALVGLERQKQLMGCSDESCMAELAGALGVDGIITGSVGKFGTAYQVNVTIISSKDGRVLAAHSQKLRGEEEVLDELTSAARNMGPKVLDRLGRNTVPAPPAVEAASPQPPPGNAPLVTAAPPAAPGHWKAYWWAPMAAGVAALGTGGFYFYRMSVEYDGLTAWREASTGAPVFLTTMEGYARRAAFAQTMGYTLAGVGLAAAGVGTWMLLTQPTTAPRVSFAVTPDGAWVGVGGVLP